ncbi:fluoride efflux transporter CrcB [Methanococcoides alaskense]|uniref:Fluoride-specific ion channel FluC n=1 Tax=Methanococcoides alaskense TaxID=325778 RepID=A0AA90Z782_9EURY|nr:fluoride efflux transporter CrcB [Methanococcoides alaskense]MDA0525017.1 fluoride efflux transporter CrcB [Methanococcoides alaskense]MDR6222066.1 CrcB protein [Methanococcoides alaskense]
MTGGLEEILLVGLGGAIGAPLRYIVSGIVPKARNIPTGTLLVNIIGSIVLSTLTFASSKNISLHLVNIGVLGSFTTYSTFAYETSRMLEEGRTIDLILNIILNLSLCILGVLLGHQLASLI